jgi:homoserine kinase
MIISKEKTPLTVYAPASMGNVGVGFDLLGAALMPIDGSRLGDCVTIHPISNVNTSATLSHGNGELHFSQTGIWSHKLPTVAEDNIVYQCAQFFLDKLGVKAGIALNLEKNLPVGSGLGSSASSVVAALYGLNEYFDKPFTSQALLALMGEFEGKISGSVHFDNVAPSYLGGMQLMLDSPSELCAAIPHFKHWYWLVAYPGISLSTAKMRALLPAQYDKAVTIDFGRHLSAFVHASHSHNPKLAIEVLKDVLAEPYRADAIPGYKQARDALNQLGMLTTGISGSGPTLFSITDDINLAEQAKAWLTDNYVTQAGGFVHVCRIDELGARRI